MWNSLCRVGYLCRETGLQACDFAGMPPDLIEQLSIVAVENEKWDFEQAQRAAKQAAALARVQNGG